MRGKLGTCWKDIVTLLDCMSEHGIYFWIARATYLHQNLHQDCTFNAMSVLGWFSVSFITLFLTVTNLLGTSTYRGKLRLMLSVAPLATLQKRSS
jgi:hypothetical protein